MLENIGVFLKTGVPYRSNLVLQFKKSFSSLLLKIDSEAGNEKPYTLCRGDDE
jgi:hypothetical protein